MHSLFPCIYISLLDHLCKSQLLLKFLSYSSFNFNFFNDMIKSELLLFWGAMRDFNRSWNAEPPRNILFLYLYLLPHFKLKIAFTIFCHPVLKVWAWGPLRLQATSSHKLQTTWSWCQPWMGRRIYILITEWSAIDE